MARFVSLEKRDLVGFASLTSIECGASVGLPRWTLCCRTDVMMSPWGHLLTLDHVRLFNIGTKAGHPFWPTM